MHHPTHAHSGHKHAHSHSNARADSTAAPRKTAHSSAAANAFLGTSVGPEAIASVVTPVSASLSTLSTVVEWIDEPNFLPRVVAPPPPPPSPAAAKDETVRPLPPNAAAAAAAAAGAAVAGSTFESVAVQWVTSVQSWNPSITHAVQLRELCQRGMMLRLPNEVIHKIEEWCNLPTPANASASVVLNIFDLYARCLLATQRSADAYRVYSCLVSEGGADQWFGLQPGDPLPSLAHLLLAGGTGTPPISTQISTTNASTQRGAHLASDTPKTPSTAAKKTTSSSIAVWPPSTSAGRLSTKNWHLNRLLGRLALGFVTSGIRLRNTYLPALFQTRRLTPFQWSCVGFVSWKWKVAPQAPADTTRNPISDTVTPGEASTSTVATAISTLAHETAAAALLTCVDAPVLQFECCPVPNDNGGLYLFAHVLQNSKGEAMSSFPFVRYLPLPNGQLQRHQLHVQWIPSGTAAMRTWDLYATQNHTTIHASQLLLNDGRLFDPSSQSTKPGTADVADGSARAPNKEEGVVASTAIVPRSLVKKGDKNDDRLPTSCLVEVAVKPRPSTTTSVPMGWTQTRLLGWNGGGNGRSASEASVETYRPSMWMLFRSFDEPITTTSTPTTNETPAGTAVPATAVASVTTTTTDASATTSFGQETGSSAKLDKSASAVGTTDRKSPASPPLKTYLVHMDSLTWTPVAEGHPTAAAASGKSGVYPITLDPSSDFIGRLPGFNPLSWAWFQWSGEWFAVVTWCPFVVCHCATRSQTKMVDSDALGVCRVVALDTQPCLIELVACTSLIVCTQQYIRWARHDTKLANRIEMEASHGTVWMTGIVQPQAPNVSLEAYYRSVVIAISPLTTHSTKHGYVEPSERWRYPFTIRLERISRDWIPPLPGHPHATSASMKTPTFQTCVEIAPFPVRMGSYIDWVRRTPDNEPGPGGDTLRFSLTLHDRESVWVHLPSSVLFSSTAAPPSP